MRLWVSVALVILGAADAAADNPDLERARELKAELRYREAAEALAAARARGTAEPAQLAHMWRLAGEIAAGLERRDEAVDHFARWIALVPDAVLPEGVSPKLAEPFAAARARLGDRRLALTPSVDGRRVTLEIADPLSMIREVRIERASGELVATRNAPPYAASVPGDAAASLIAVALDDAGNQLAVVGGIEVASTAIVSPPPGEPPLYARPLPWAAVAAVAAAVGATFGVLALDAQSELDDLSEQARREPFSVTFEQLDEVEGRGRQRALVANIGFAVAGAAAITAGVLWLVGRGDDRVEPAPGGVAVRF